MRPPRAALSISIVLLLAGCMGFGGPPPSDAGAEAVVADAAANAEQIETYRFRSDISVVASKGDETRRISIDVRGAVDRRERRLRANTSFRGETRQSYVVGNKAYTECSGPWGWGVENVSDAQDGNWSNVDPLGRQLALMQSSPVYWAGNQTIDGTAVHVVESRPSEDTLRKFSDRRQTSVFGPGIEDARLTAYVAKDSGRVFKTVFTFTVTDDGGTADAEMTTYFEDVGADVNVTVPDEAREHPRQFGCPGS